jgi:hypothetical protein
MQAGLFFGNLHCSFDALPPFYGKAAHCLCLFSFRALVRGGTQKRHLLAKAVAPATYQ